MNVNRKTYYNWLNRGKVIRKKTLKQEDVEQLIRSIYIDHKQRYGSPRITKELEKKGIKISRITVAKYMKEMGLKSKLGRRFRQTTDSKHSYPVANNLLNQNFKSTEIGKKWVSDISYIPVKEGFIYLTIIMDLHDRKIIGWSNSKTLKASDTVWAAWHQALGNRKLDIHGIFHSDRGTQYASTSFANELKINNIQQSMSRKGNCWDNAVAESFFKTIKAELLDFKRLKSREETELLLFEYIEIYYNRNRRHSALDNLTISEFHQQNRIF